MINLIFQRSFDIVIFKNCHRGPQRRHRVSQIFFYVALSVSSVHLCVTKKYYFLQKFNLNHPDVFCFINPFVLIFDIVLY